MLFTNLLLISLVSSAKIVPDDNRSAICAVPKDEKTCAAQISNGRYVCEWERKSGDKEKHCYPHGQFDDHREDICPNFKSKKECEGTAIRGGSQHPCEWEKKSGDDKKKCYAKGAYVDHREKICLSIIDKPTCIARKVNGEVICEWEKKGGRIGCYPRMTTEEKAEIALAVLCVASSAKNC